MDKKMAQEVIMSLLLLNVWIVTSDRHVSGHLDYSPYSNLLSSNTQLDKTRFGWTGYINTSAEVIPLLNNLISDGWNAIRYQSEPLWWNASTPHPINYTILDYVVNEAEKRGMRTYLLCEHTYQRAFDSSGPFIDGHETDWINDWKTIAARYANRKGVIDAWSEYNNLMENKTQATLAYQHLGQSLVDALRQIGINLPIHFNLWWNSRIFKLNDTNYSIGRHLYGTAFDNYNPSTPIDFEMAVEESGVNAKINQYFYENNNMYYQEAKRLGVPFVISEMGASENQTKAYGGRYSMSVGNIVYAMKVLRTALEFNVTSMMHRIGEYADYDLYYRYAQQYFSLRFFTPPLAGDANHDHIVDVGDLGTISAHWYPGPPIGPLDYAPPYDLNDDGAIDISDAGIVSRDWGKSW